MTRIVRYQPRALSRDWGTEWIVAATERYMGKVLLYKGGHAGGLQYHVEKDETFYLFEGEAWIDSDNGMGQLVRVRMRPGDSFHIPPGAPHRFVAITDCVVFEASTLAYDDRVRCEDAYGEPPAGGLPTARP